MIVTNSSITSQLNPYFLDLFSSYQCMIQVNIVPLERNQNYEE